MGNVQCGAPDEGSGGAVLFLLKASLLYHPAECSIQREDAKGTHAMCRIL